METSLHSTFLQDNSQFSQKAQTILQTKVEYYKMQSRVFPAIWKLIQQVEEVSKLSAAQLVHCDTKTAQRILTHLHVEGHTRICGWIRSKGSPVPVYILHDGKPDLRKPAPIADSPVERNEKRREYKRKLRETKPVKINNVRLGIWGL